MLFLLHTLAFFFGPITPAFSWPSVHPTGTTIHIPTAASPGYVLFTPLGQATGYNTNTNRTEDKPGILYLINLKGEVVHQWQVPFFPLYGRLQKNGNVVVIGQIGKNSANRAGFGKLWMGGAAGRIVELTWDGKPVFTHEDLSMHHDAVKLPNGHFMYLTWEKVPPALQAKVRGGVKSSEFPGGIMFNDGIVEVDQQGKVVWTWHANEHLDPDIDIIGPVYKREEWLHGNSISVLDNGNVVLTSRSTDSILVIDRKTKKIILRWGNASYLDNKTGNIEHRLSPTTLGGPHDSEQIPARKGKTGNLLCYDNGFYSGSSRAVEINLTTQKLVWQSGRPGPPGVGRTHFSDIMGSAQRLTNGNTLICEGVNGRFFQTTPLNEIVWEYVNPYIPQPNLHGSVFKIRQYPLDWCPQFKGLQTKEASTYEKSQEQPPATEPLSTSTVAPVVALLLLLVLVIWKRWRQGLP